jgi:hypothetical protein
MGSKIEWTSRYRDPSGTIQIFSILNENSTRRFTKTDQVKSSESSTGMIVKIDTLNAKQAKKVSTDKLRQSIILEFAHYLKAYEAHNIKIYLNNDILNISNALESEGTTQSISVKNPDDNNLYNFQVQLFHWKDKNVHERYFCTKDFAIIHRDAITSF